MPTVIKAQLDWLKEHAVRGNDKVWRCKEKGTDIQTAAVGRSIWIRPFSGGGGEVREVLHLTCLACSPNAELPEYGEPIYDDELVKVREGTS
ncbi:MAG TPA: hypothetical protein VEB60_01730 [Candidatus Paceibacterota bacterium]|nr:hypothetical protein [Candidatus Paceibacterota bacterium]